MQVSFRNSRNLNLAGILHTPAKPTNKAVICSHGFTSNKDGSHGKFPRLGEALSKIGIATLRFDFSGCGESDPDTITVSKQVDDLKSAIAFMRWRGYNDLVLIGSSLGGLISLLAYDKDILTMSLWAPVTKAKTPGHLKTPEARKELLEKGVVTITNKKGTYRVDKRFLEERETLAHQDILSRIKCPVLIIHGDADDVLPYQDSVEAIKHLPRGSRLDIMKGANHHFTGKVDELVYLTVKWLESL